MEQDMKQYLILKKTFALHRISTWEDFDHVLGETENQEKDRISFQ